MSFYENVKEIMRLWINVMVNPVLLIGYCFGYMSMSIYVSSEINFVRMLLLWPITAMIINMSVCVLLSMASYLPGGRACS